MNKYRIARHTVKGCYTDKVTQEYWTIQQFVNRWYRVKGTWEDIQEHTLFFDKLVSKTKKYYTKAFAEEELKRLKIINEPKKIEITVEDEI